jgi:hypothetical protein
MLHTVLSLSFSMITHVCYRTNSYSATLFVKKKVVFVYSRHDEDYRMKAGNIVLQLGL